MSINSSNVDSLFVYLTSLPITVTELLPHIYRYTVNFCGKDSEASVDTADGQSILTIQYDEFINFLRLGQGYYIWLKEWQKMSEFTTSMLRCCGYIEFSIAYEDLHTDYFSSLRQGRQNLNNGQRAPNARKGTKDVLCTPEEIRIRAAYGCEMSVVAAHLARIGYEYFNDVCVTFENSKNPEEKSCLIPICILPETNSALSNALKKDGDMQSDGQSYSSAIPYRNSLTVENHVESDNRNGVQNSKDVEIVSRDGEDDSTETNGLSKGKRSRSQSSAADSADRPNVRMKLSNLIHDSTPSSKRQKLDNPQSDQESADCLKGVHEALAVLKKGAECLEYLESMWNDLQQSSAGNKIPLNDWEEELSCVLESYDLPFDINNSVTLLRSDIALSAAAIPGNLAKALKLSQALCDRIEVQRSKEKATILTSAAQELDIPFMLAFRILYNIGIIYLLVGNIQASVI